MPTRPNRLRALSCAIPAALAVAALGTAPTAVASGPVAHAAKTCGVSENDYPGNGYFTRLTVRGTSCANGKKVAKAHYHCRIAQGGIKGHCKRRVLGYRCKEGTRHSVPGVYYNVKVSCSNGSRRVGFFYQQNF